jgi:hypothetical protein
MKLQLPRLLSLAILLVAASTTEAQKPIEYVLDSGLRVRLILDRVAHLAKPDAGTASKLERPRKMYMQQTFADVDVDKITLPAGLTKTKARAGIELQRMVRSIVWGDLGAYKERLDEVKPEAVPAAVAKHLARSRACLRGLHTI